MKKWFVGNSDRPLSMVLWLKKKQSKEVKFYNLDVIISVGYRRIVNAVDVLWLLIHVGIEIYLYWGCANLKQKCHLHQN